MIKKIDKDEWYPVFYLTDDYGTDVDIPEDKVAWIKAAFAEFAKAQYYLQELCKPPLLDEQKEILQRHVVITTDAQPCNIDDVKVSAMIATISGEFA